MDHSCPASRLCKRATLEEYVIPVTILGLQLRRSRLALCINCRSVKTYQRIYCAYRGRGTQTSVNGMCCIDESLWQCPTNQSESNMPQL